MARPSGRRTASSHVSAVLMAVGLAVVCVGAFLPWLRSGAATKSSFELAGVLDRLGPADGPWLTAALTMWIMIPLVSVTSIALAVLGYLRTSGTIATIVAFLAGTVAVATYVVGSGDDSAISTVPAGPLTTCAGGSITILGALGVVLTDRRTPATTGTPPGPPHPRR